MNRVEIRKITREVAKRHNVSPAEVRRDMQSAINSAYLKPNAAALTIPRKGEVPTSQEFVGHVAEKIKAEKAGM